MYHLGVVHTVPPVTQKCLCETLEGCYSVSNSHVSYVHDQLLSLFSEPLTVAPLVRLEEKTGGVITFALRHFGNTIEEIVEKIKYFIKVTCFSWPRVALLIGIVKDCKECML